MPDYSNQEWLEALRSADNTEALTELREYLKRSLRYALSSRVDPNRLDALIEDLLRMHCCAYWIKWKPSEGKADSQPGLPRWRFAWR